MKGMIKGKPHRHPLPKGSKSFLLKLIFYSNLFLAQLQHMQRFRMAHAFFKTAKKSAESSPIASPKVPLVAPLAPVAVAPLPAVAPPVVEMVNQVLTLCKIPDSMDIAQMKERMKAYMDPRKSFYQDTGRAPYVEDEFSEYFTAKTTGGAQIGAGSCAMDVKTSASEGIDAMCVLMNKSKSNEKSLIQNFSSSGSNLDLLFKEKKDTEAIALFMTQYMKKLQDVKAEKALTDLYILAFVSTMTEIYLVCFKIAPENIAHVTSMGFVGKEEDDVKNIVIGNFVNPAYGDVRLYKSKKRVELRLLPAVLQSEHAVKIYSMD